MILRTLGIPFIHAIVHILSIPDPGSLPQIYAGLGDKGKAFEYLEKAYQERSSDLPYFLKFDLSIDSLHSDPRFEDLMRRMNFPK